ncbi:MAG: sigma-70 family RNA polymerase sigma factor [Vulcanimicrobiaceae bacterium]
MTTQLRAQRERRFAAFHYLCRRGARKFRRSGIDACDLEQVAAIGLIKACDRFDAATATPFEAYAWLVIVGELMHYVRDHEPLVRIPRNLRTLELRSRRGVEMLRQRLGREPTAAELCSELAIAPSTAVGGVRSRSLAVPIALDALGPAAAARLERRAFVDRRPSTEDRVLLHGALTDLSPVQRAIVLGIHACGLSKIELSARLGYSSRHVARLEKRALARMQAAMS